MHIRSYVPTFSKIRQSGAEILQLRQIHRPAFQGRGKIVALFFRRWGELSQICEKHKTIVGASQFVLDFSYIAPSFHTRRCTEKRLGSQIESKFLTLFTRVKLGEGWVKYLNRYFKVRAYIMIQSLISVGPLRGLGI